MELEPAVSLDSLDEVAYGIRDGEGRYMKDAMSIIGKAKG